MKDKQKKILKVVGVVLLLMLLFPPFHSVFPNGFTRNEGYAFIFSGSGTATVDIGLLFIQWIGALIIGAIAWKANE